MAVGPKKTMRPEMAMGWRWPWDWEMTVGPGMAVGPKMTVGPAVEWR